MQKDVHRRWKQGQSTKEEFRNIAWACRDGIRKDKAQLELRFAKDIKGNESFCCYIISKRINKKNAGLQLNGAGDLVTKEIAKVLNASFASVFTDMVS